MDNNTILQKLNSAPGSKFCKLNEYNSNRMGGAKTTYLPSLEEVARVIKSIPKGKTKTISELRQIIARKAGTETSCPATLLKYWKWMANLSDESKIKYKQYDIPWWRVLKDGKPSRHMPGGIPNQMKILKSEGVII
jgi:alkylated DNA nucleotide flippase Atl1